MWAGEGMGVGPVRYNAVDADAYRGFGFPGADEMGNMFQMYRDFEKEVTGARSADATRQLNPQAEEALKRKFHAQSATQFLAFYPAQILVHGDFAEHDAISNFPLCVMGSKPGTIFV